VEKAVDDLNPTAPATSRASNGGGALAHNSAYFTTGRDVIYGAKVGKFTTAERIVIQPRASNDAGNQSGVSYIHMMHYIYVESADPCFALWGCAGKK